MKPLDDVDVADRVVAQAGRVDRSGLWWGLRAALFVVAGAQILLAIPDVFGDNHHHSSHLRHLAAFQLAFAVGLIVVAIRPAKARALVPITAVLAVAMAGAWIADIASETTAGMVDLQHVLEFAGLILVWLLATRRGWSPRART